MFQDHLNIHSISPKKVIRGDNTWKESKYLIPLICKSPLILGRNQSTLSLRKIISSDLATLGLKTTNFELSKDCCEFDLKKATEVFQRNSCDGIIAAGGGKVLDAGKLIADRLSIPCITIPLSAATCAGWTALSNIYSPEGAFIKDIQLKSCPELLIFDYKFISTAPKKTLSSGIADAIAKWYEASVSSGASHDGLVQQAVQMARVLRDQLLIDSSKAINSQSNIYGLRVAEACALTAGLIGGIGGSKCRTAAAHAIHNGLTQLKFKRKMLHGEIVGYGIIIQLYLEEIAGDRQLARQSRLQLIPFLKSLNLPTTLSELNLESNTNDNIIKACKFSCKNGSDIFNLPFNITHGLLLEAIKRNETDQQSIHLSNSSMKELI